MLWAGDGQQPVLSANRPSEQRKGVGIGRLCPTLVLTSDRQNVTVRAKGGVEFPILYSSTDAY